MGAADYCCGRRTFLWWMFYAGIANLKESRPLPQLAGSPAAAGRSGPDCARDGEECGLARLGRSRTKGPRLRPRQCHRKLGLFHYHHLSLRLWLPLRLWTIWLWLSRLLGRRRRCISHPSRTSLRRLWRSVLRSLFLFLPSADRVVPIQDRYFREWARRRIPTHGRIVLLSDYFGRCAILNRNAH